MADYTVHLQPDLVNMTTEGSMDTSILNGNSIQRTVHGIMIHNEDGSRKMVGRLKDGSTFNDSIESLLDYQNVGFAVTNLYILINDNYVDYVENPTNANHEANNLIAYFDQLGISYKPFTGIEETDFAIIPNTKKLLIPELEESELAPYLSEGAEMAIESFVQDGGTLLMFAPGSGDLVDVLNDVFGFSLSENDADEPIAITTDGGTLFPGESSTIPAYSATESLDTTTLPEGSTVIYEGDGDNQSVVTLIPYGDGKIYVLGWDWYDAQPLGEADGGWLHLLQSIIES